MSYQSKYYYHQIDSTNRVLKEMVRKGAPEGTVVLSPHQTAGRGRMGKMFFSPPDCGLYLSILYRPENKSLLIDPLSLTMLTAVAVFQSIENICHISPGIKWVNDLYYNGKKIAGILAEGISEKNHLSAVVIGVGINLWDPLAGYPEELRSIAGSIYGPGEPNKKIWNDLADSLIQNLFPLSFSLEAHHLYCKNSIVLGKKVLLSGYDFSIEGIVSGFTENGGLVLITKDKIKKVFHSGEISLRLSSNILDKRKGNSCI